MAQKTKLSELLKENPNANGEIIQEAQKQLRALKAQGVGGSGYRLAIPYSNRIRVGFAATDRDPRCVTLSNR